MKYNNNCKLIAEIGLSHEGSLGIAQASIEAAASVGADIVKFQVHSAEHESSSQEKFRVPFSKQDSTRSDYWQRTSFSKKQWEILINQSKELNIEFSVSVFNSYSLNQMLDLGVQTIKLGSGDLLNEELAEALQDFSGFVILSTGMATWAEINEALELYFEFKNDNRLAVLQCTSKYPTKLNQVGINIMEEIITKYGVPSGLSDHTNNLSSSYIAISRGAKFIEKHVVFSQLMFGPDISSSIEFEDFKKLSEFRDHYNEVSCFVDKDETARELSEIKKLFGRSLGLKSDFPTGHILELNDFCLRKPGGGLSWQNRLDLVGKRLIKPYLHEDLLEAAHVE